MELMNDEPGVDPFQPEQGVASNQGAQVSGGYATPRVGRYGHDVQGLQPQHVPDTATGLPTELVLMPPQPRKAARVRLFTWLLLFLFAVTAVLASQVRRPPTLVHVSDAPPPIEAPTGALLTAYELARDATVRIEARRGGWNGYVVGVGTGFFVSPEGMLLTAYHVVDTSTSGRTDLRYVAVTADEQVYRLQLVGFDAYMDLAAMQATVDRAVPYLPLADRVPSTGTPVVAIGNSRDDFLGARAGRVTRLGVQASRADFADDTIELTNSLAPGDSGGPVVNARGEAVGVVSFISFNPGAMSSQGFIPPFLQGLSLSRDFASYAVPLTADSQVVSAVLSGQARDLPVIGFSWSQNDYRPGQSSFDLGPRPGPVVSQVAPGGPADRAGLRSSGTETVENADGSTSVVPVVDVIVALDGVPTPTFYDLLALVKSKNIGDVVTLTVQRGSATYRLQLELGAKTSVFLGG